MTSKRQTRSFRKIDESDLQRLAEIGVATLKREFARQRTTPMFEEVQLIGICLCQGAADHYLGHESRKGRGIDDFDIWAFFYPQKTYRFGNAKPVIADFGLPKFGRSYSNGKRLLGRRVDVFWRQVQDVVSLDCMAPISDYLSSSDATTARELRKKSAIVVWPWDELGRVLWNPKQLGRPTSYDPWD
ncbi:MAG: hypothetical protein WAW96_04130 [Alphaproteobacteria bacterium]